MKIIPVKAPFFPRRKDGHAKANIHFSLTIFLTLTKETRFIFKTLAVKMLMYENLKKKHFLY